MKRSKFTEEQIVAILREQGWEDQKSIRWIDFPTNGSKTADLCRKHGVSSATFYA